eukprot:s2851_g5.t1
MQKMRSQGGFFLLGDISDLCGPGGPLHESWEASLRPDEAKDWTCCRALAAEVGVVCLPVSPFFGEKTPESIRTRFARFCFAKTDATLEEGPEEGHLASGEKAAEPPRLRRAAAPPLFAASTGATKKGR